MKEAVDWGACRWQVLCEGNRDRCNFSLAQRGGMTDVAMINILNNVGVLRSDGLSTNIVCRLLALWCGITWGSVTVLLLRLHTIVKTKNI